LKRRIASLEEELERVKKERKHEKKPTSKDEPKADQKEKKT
jgi:uncharacterized small protein (DUF1192 family)